MIPIRDNIKSSRYPVVNTALIAACVIVFVYQLFEPAAIEAYAFRPAYIASLTTIQDLGYVGAGGSLLLSMFMHGGLLHIGFNMLFLWVFGDNVEDRMGVVLYLILYILSGFAAATTQILIDPDSRIPLIGASGAIGDTLHKNGFPK